MHFLFRLLRIPLVLFTQLAEFISNWLDRVFYGPSPISKPARTIFWKITIDPEGTIFYKDELQMDVIVIRKKNEVFMEPNFRDEDGNITTVLGSIPAWTSSDESVLQLEVAEDGMSAVARPTGLLGRSTVQLHVDADPGQDVVELVGSVDIEVGPGLAVFVSLNPVVRDQAPAPAPAPEPEPEVPADPPAEAPAEPETPAPEADPADPEVPADPPAETPAPEGSETPTTDGENRPA